MRAGRVRLQQPRQLGPIQAVAAHQRAIEKQHRDIVPVAACQKRIGVDVDELDGRQRHRPAKSGKLREHLLAQWTVVPVHDRETPGRHGTLAAARADWRRTLRLDLRGDELHGGGRDLAHGGDLVAVDHG